MAPMFGGGDKSSKSKDMKTLFIVVILLGLIFIGSYAVYSDVELLPTTVSRLIPQVLPRSHLPWENTGLKPGESKLVNQSEWVLINQTTPEMPLNVTEVTALVKLPCRSSMWHQSTHGFKDERCALQRQLSNQSVIIFTSFKDLEHRQKIHKNTIYNWALFSPVVQPVLFNDSTDHELLRAALKNGWTILPCHSKKPDSAPRVKYMYQTVQSHFPNATFYGWSNGDILFDRGLLTTLNHTMRCFPENTGIFVTGARYNVYNKNRSTIIQSEQVDQQITQHAHKNKFSTMAEDYFFIYKNQFPWQRVPDAMVIGRPGYDNYLVAMAIKNGLAVIDGSCTIGALHQMGPEGTRAGFMNKDRNFNNKLVSHLRSWKLGGLSKTKYFTVLSKGGGVFIKQTVT